MSPSNSIKTTNVIVEQVRQQTIGGVKSLLLLFFPIAFITFTDCLFVFIEKLFLGRLSALEMEAAVNAAYAWQIFQVSCMALASAAPVYIARCWGKGDCKAIGPGVWQFIWFCFFSIGITVPLGILYGNFYFRGTEIKSIVFPYYYFLLGINFLFPLITSLASFYISQGKTRLLLWASLASQVIKICLAYVLILGWNTEFLGIGLMGGAVSTLIAQGGLALVLMSVFLNKKNALKFDSRKWHFQPRLFWKCIHLGALRSINRIFTLLSWASISHLMSAKGGEHLLILSIGGTLFFFFPFISDAIFQAETTIASQIIGMGEYSLLKRASKSAILLAFVMIGIFTVPCLIFPIETFHFLFPFIHLDPNILKDIFLGCWLCFAFFTISNVPLSHVMAYKDSNFLLFMGGMNWINGYLLMYIAMNVVEIRASQFWIALSLMHASTLAMYCWRMNWLQRKNHSLSIVQSSS